MKRSVLAVAAVIVFCCCVAYYASDGKVQQKRRERPEHVFYVAEAAKEINLEAAVRSLKDAGIGFNLASNGRFLSWYRNLEGGRVLCCVYGKKVWLYLPLKGRERAKRVLDFLLDEVASVLGVDLAPAGFEKLIRFPYTDAKGKEAEGMLVPQAPPKWYFTFVDAKEAAPAGTDVHLEAEGRAVYWVWKEKDRTHRRKAVEMVRLKGKGDVTQGK